MPFGQCFRHRTYRVVHMLRMTAVLAGTSTCASYSSRMMGCLSRQAFLEKSLPPSKRWFGECVGRNMSQKGAEFYCAAGSYCPKSRCIRFSLFPRLARKVDASTFHPSILRPEQNAHDNRLHNDTGVSHTDRSRRTEISIAQLLHAQKPCDHALSEAPIEETAPLSR